MHLAAVFPPRKKIQKKGHWIHLAVTLPPREKGGRIRLCTIVCGKYLVHLGKQLVHHGNVGLHPVVVDNEGLLLQKILLLLRLLLSPALSDTLSSFLCFIFGILNA